MSTLIMQVFQESAKHCISKRFKQESPENNTTVVDELLANKKKALQRLWKATSADSMTAHLQMLQQNVLEKLPLSESLKQATEAVQQLHKTLQQVLMLSNLRSMREKQLSYMIYLLHRVIVQLNIKHAHLTQVI